MADCPKCHGEGGWRENVLTGYVSHEMAMDACDMAYEGQPVYETIDVVCNFCSGIGEVSEEEADEYEFPF